MISGVTAIPALEVNSNAITTAASGSRSTAAMVAAITVAIAGPSGNAGEVRGEQATDRAYEDRREHRTAAEAAHRHGPRESFAREEQAERGDGQRPRLLDDWSQRA